MTVADRRTRAPRFSLFFFASAHERSASQQYRLMVESAQVADELGVRFRAIFPEWGVVAWLTSACLPRLSCHTSTTWLDCRTWRGPRRIIDFPGPLSAKEAVFTAASDGWGPVRPHSVINLL
jgi:hypothetical protein